jgi:hypothetical protein
MTEPAPGCRAVVCDAGDLQLRSMSTFDAHMLHVRSRSRAGDREAIAELDRLWPSDAPCFICAGAVGVKPSTLILDDPDRPTERAILTPECRSCADKPTHRHDQAVRRMAAAMWPVWRLRGSAWTR